jgi:hypothetical protein
MAEALQWADVISKECHRMSRKIISARTGQKAWSVKEVVVAVVTVVIAPLLVVVIYLW